MGWLDIITDITLEIVTLGGHSHISKAQQEYECIYKAYSEKYKVAKIKEAEYEAELTRLGQVTDTSFKTLSFACEITAQSFYLANPSDKLGKVSAGRYAPKAEALLAQYQSVSSVAKGAGGAAATGVGSWALVSLLGVASTGTPIVALSGVASTNAILAWFGGGALAAGGAGMAGGATILGAIVAVPFVAFTAWSAHSKAAEIEAANKKISRRDNALKSTIVELDNAISATRLTHQKLSLFHLRLEALTLSTYRSLFPYGFYTKIWRALKDLCGQRYYTASEMPLIFKLEEEIAQFTSQFNLGQQKVSGVISGPRRKPSHFLQFILAVILLLCSITLICIYANSVLPTTH